MTNLKLGAGSESAWPGLRVANDERTSETDNARERVASDSGGAIISEATDFRHFCSCLLPSDGKMEETYGGDSRATVMSMVVIMNRAHCRANGRTKMLPRRCNG
ncbi:unnamed protein product [Linum trigynum]|uniref:Uncharacterized protein n=1 Tax=Linum trigynum TaxID=586398 RepID=A0AAV2FSU1_9ROSI